MTSQVVTKFRGDDWTIVVTCLQSDGVTPQNLTGYTAGGELFLHYGDTPRCFQAPPVALTPTMTDPTSGQITFRASATITAEVGADAVGATAFLNRLHAWVIDPSGMKQTVAVVGILVNDPRTVQLAVS